MSTRVEFTSPTGGPAAPETPAAPDANRPDWLPDNFKTPEDMATSYRELQAELTRTKQAKGLPAAPTETPAPAAQGTPTETPAPAAQGTPAQDDAAKQVADAAGVDLSSYQTEFASTGDVAPESRAKIIDGLKKVLGDDAETLVNQYIDGRKLMLANDASAIRGAAGGDEAYNQMTAWAATALTKDEIAVFNSQVESGNRAAAVFAVEALRARFEKVNGSAPSRIGAAPSAPGSGAPVKFRSSAEMVSAMKDPRYRTDPAYRDSVQARIP